MPDSRIPLYLITGFLDSGKTTLLIDTLNMDYFNDGQRTVLIRCEDGEEEYDQEKLSKAQLPSGAGGGPVPAHPRLSGTRWSGATSPSGSCWNITECGLSSSSGT